MKLIHVTSLAVVALLALMSIAPPQTTTKLFSGKLQELLAPGNQFSIVTSDSTGVHINDTQGGAWDLIAVGSDWIQVQNNGNGEVRFYNTRDIYVTVP